MQRNIETFFPSLSSPAVEDSSGPSTSGSTTDDGRLAKAVIATAASTFAFWGLLFLLLHFFVTRRQWRRRRRRQAEEEGEKSRPEKISFPERLRSRASKRKSVFVDEDGLDAVYWREFKGKVGAVHSDVDESRSSRREDDEEESVGLGYTDEAKKKDWRIQEERLVPAGSIGSSSPVFDDRSSSDLPLPPNRRLPPPPGRFVPSALRPQAAPPELRPPQLPLSAGIGNTKPPRMPSPLSPNRDLSSAPRLATASEVRNTKPPRPPSPSRFMFSAPHPATAPSEVGNARSSPSLVISSPSPPATVTSEVSYTSTAPPQLPAISPSAPETKPSAAPPPPPLPPAKTSDPAHEPPRPTSKASAKAPPPPPPPLRPPAGTTPGPAPPPPPPGGRPGGGSSRPPPAPGPTSAVQGQDGAKKLKPLHWDKMNAINVEHSMVWDKLHNGSFKVDEDIMEALFGTVVTNRKATNYSGDSESKAAAVAGFTPITLLDPRKSQNIAIVLRSTTVSRQAVIEGAIDGRGLNTDVLERLITIAPTKEEEDVVRAYSGDPGMLADAENFLFHIIRAVPAAPFARLDAMLFRANYEPELRHLKQTLRTLEAACGELRTPTRGLFLKLLETVLKAGNRMNAGTARGNAQAFNLTALRKLADVKSTDGSTTLLHFVVEEVVRSEGKRLVINNRGHHSGALERVPSRSSSAAAREEREKEYTMLGLPLVGGLSDEFANLKKAAGFDCDALKTACPTLQARVEDIKRLVESLSAGGEGSGGFVKEMRAFVEAAKGDLKATAVEQGRVMEVVKKTNEYYHPGAAKERDGQPLHLFVVVKDFLDMVDKACVDITRNLQKKKQAAAAVARSGSEPTAAEKGVESRRRPVARFPNLPPHFLKSNSKSDSSSDEED